MTLVTEPVNITPAVQDSIEHGLTLLVDKGGIEGWYRTNTGNGLVYHILQTPTPKAGASEPELAGSK